MCDGDHDHGTEHTMVVPVDLDAFAGERIPLAPVERVSITTVVDNACDMLAADVGPAKRRAMPDWPTLSAPTMAGGITIDGPRAEFGFSAHVEVELPDGSVHRLLFDTGVSPDGMVENMARMDLALGDVEVVVCSHGHFDHTTGLDGLARRLGRTQLPVLIHPLFWSQRRVTVPGRDPIELPSTSKRALEDAGFDVIERERPSFLFGDSVLITGEVPRTTDFETGFALHQALRHGSWQPDPLILDDQALMVHVRGKGLVVLTGCGHSGIVNIVRYARQLTGVAELLAVVGGFHLTGALFEPVIPATVAALAELEPAVVVPAHCTGALAARALADRLPGACISNTVGTRFELAA